MRRAFLTLVATSLAGAACDAPSADQTGDGRPGDPPRVVAVEAQRFGGDFDGVGALSGVFDVDVSADGFVFASEPTLAHVMVFAPDGRHVRTIGRRGEGPGEFQAPGNLAWRGDTLTVLDMLQGVSLMSVDGAYLDRIAFQIQEPGRPFAILPIFPLADGSMASFRPPFTTSVLRGELTHQVWYKVSREGELLDTLARESLAGQYYSVDVGGGRSATATHPLPSSAMLAIPPDGSWLVLVEREPAVAADGAAYRVVRLDLAGDTTELADLPYEPLPLGPEQVDSMTAAMGEGFARQFDLQPAAVASEIRGQLEWPRFRPPVTQVLADTDGRTWVRREVGVEPGDSVRWEILGPDLTRTGYTLVPGNLDVKVVVGDALYGVTQDELDVPTIVRYDLRW